MNQDDNGITKLGCVNHDCDKCKAQQQEPYGWKVYGVNSLFVGEFAEADAKDEAKRIGGTCIAFPLYTSPPIEATPLASQRSVKPWVGLTDEEILEINDTVREQQGWLAFVRAIEAKLMEKNGA